MLGLDMELGARASCVLKTSTSLVASQRVGLQLGELRGELRVEDELRTGTTTNYGTSCESSVDLQLG
jgi:hypothetical protein